MKKRNYVHLDFFRGIASIVVLLHHSKLMCFAPSIHSITNPNLLVTAFVFMTSLGHSAVIVFFVLSGFVIANSVHAAISEGRWTWSSYLLSRLMRLWTPLLPALALGMGLDCIGVFLFRATDVYSGGLGWPLRTDIVTRLDFTTFLGNALFVQKIYVDTLGSNGALWSLSYEFWYYILFPLLVCSVAKLYSSRVRVSLFFLAVVVLCLVGGGIRAYFPLWLLGAISYYVFSKRKLRSRNVANLGFVFALFALMALLVVQKAFFPNAGQLLWDYFLAVVFANTVYFAIQSSVLLGINAYSRIAELTSKISYSLYLLHTPVIFFFCGFTFSSASSRWQFTPRFAVYYILLIGFVLLYVTVVYCIFEGRTEYYKSKVRKIVS